MKIQPLNYEFTHKRRLKPEYDSAHPNSNREYNVQECEIENKTRGYNVNFSGSLPNESGAAAKTLMEKIMSTGAFRWLTGFSGAHNVAAAALIGLFLAGGLRPAITISLPGKKDLEDKIYAAGHSMASGLIGFGFSTLITTPIDSGNKYIYDDAKKISREDYNKLTAEELAEYIRKNNLSAKDIAKKMKSNTLSEEEIIKNLTDADGNNLKSIDMANYVKNNNGEIMDIRKFSGYFKIVSDKTDKINELKHKLHLTTDMVEKGKILGEIRNLEKWVDGIDKTIKNISEWAIAIPRAMLTIALIPPILKYVFHVEKKKAASAPKQEEAPIQNNTPVTPKDEEIPTMKLSMNKFMGGVK